MDHRLGEFPQRDLPLGDEHERPHSGACRVGGRGCGRVSGGSADDRIGTVRLRLRDGHRHPAVLEGTGRVQPLVLEVQLGSRSDPAGERGGRYEGRVPLQQRDDGLLGNGGEEPHVMADDPFPVHFDSVPFRDCFRSGSFASGRRHRGDGPPRRAPPACRSPSPGG